MTDSIKGSFYEYIQRENEYFEQEIKELKSDDKRKQLAIMDNSTSDSSEFDINLLQEDFEIDELKDLGLELTSLEDCEVDMPELDSGDKAPFQMMTFTLADGQAEVIKEAIKKVKKSERYEYVDNMGNENSNGNALYCIIEEWLNG